MQLQNLLVKAAPVIRNVEAATANAVVTREYVNNIAPFFAIIRGLVSSNVYRQDRYCPRTSSQTHWVLVVYERYTISHD